MANCKNCKYAGSPSETGLIWCAKNTIHVTGEGNCEFFEPKS